MLFAIRKSWKTLLSSSSYASSNKPLSTEIWNMLRSNGILAPYRGQRGGNHLRQPRKINTVETSNERDRFIGCKQRTVNQFNLLNIQVNTSSNKSTGTETMQESNTFHNFQKSKINIAHLNIRSLKNREHLVQLKELVYKNNYDIFVVTESWLNSTVTNAEVSLEGYKLSRLDRKKERGGGVCVYTRNSLRANVIKDLTETSTSGFQQLWLQIQHKKLKSILLCSAYRPPNCPNCELLRR